MDIVRWRLHNQQLTRPALATPAALVAWLGAVQAQDYPAAKWAVGQRVPGATDTAIEQAVAAGAILRTHVLRPTWHFVTAADIRWLLALTAPRVHAASAYWYRKLALDDTVFRQGHAALANALQGGRHRTRPELVAALRHAGITADDALRFTYIIGHAELEGLICSGAPRGKQFTYALLDERVPPTPPRTREEALSELTRRYFTSRGPATVPDFVWWSGLTTADARAGLALAGAHLAHEVIDGQTYWFAPSSAPPAEEALPVHLLPNYDEYIVGYTDRRAIFDPAHTARLDARGNVLFQHTMVSEGRIVGTWKRTLTRDAVMIELNPFTPLTAAETGAFAAVAADYGRFLGRPAVLPTDSR